MFNVRRLILPEVSRTIQLYKKYRYMTAAGYQNECYYYNGGENVMPVNDGKNNIIFFS